MTYYHHLIELLRKISKKSPMRTKHSCIIFKGKKILTFGFNHERSCYDGKIFPSVHAEMHALIKMKRLRKNKKYNMIVVRFHDGKLWNSKPCKYCLNEIKKYNISKVYYSMEDDLICEKVDDIVTEHVSVGFKNYHMK